MAIKSTITSTVNSFITAIVNVSKVRSALSTLLDNFYPTPIYDTQATTNVYTKSGENFTYNIKIAKIGRVVHINGWFENITAGALGSQNIVSITNTEYLPFMFAQRQSIQAFSESGQVVTLGISGSNILITTTTPSAVEFYFNGTYIVKD
jgi:hypothetical protein